MFSDAFHGVSAYPAGSAEHRRASEAYGPVLSRIAQECFAEALRVFLATGIPAVLMGIVTLFALPDSPSTSTFLSPLQKAWLADTIAAEDRRAHKVEHGNPLAHRSRRPVEQPRVGEPGLTGPHGRVVQETGQARRHSGTVSEPGSGDRRRSCACLDDCAGADGTVSGGSAA